MDLATGLGLGWGDEGGSAVGLKEPLGRGRIRVLTHGL